MPADLRLLVVLTRELAPDRPSSQIWAFTSTFRRPSCLVITTSVAREAGPSICRRLVPSMPPPASPLPRQPHRPPPTSTHHYQSHHRARHPPPPKCAGAPLDAACARARGRAALARLPHGRGVQARAEADAQDERDREGRARLRHRRFRSMLTRMPPGPLYVLYVRPRVPASCVPC